jgi:hypothetical protein
MKSLSVTLGVILIGLAIFGYAEVWGADWKYFFEDREGMLFYDVTSITRSSENIVRVWIKREYNPIGLTYMLKEHGRRYVNLSHSVGLEEINCSNKKKRNLSLKFYSKDGKVLYSSCRESEWHDIISNQFGDVWSEYEKKLCKQMGKEEKPDSLNYPER